MSVVMVIDSLSCRQLPRVMESSWRREAITERQPSVSGCEMKTPLVYLLTSHAVFLQCGCLAESLENFQKAGNWRMTFALTSQLGYSSGETMQLARTMASKKRLSVHSEVS